MPKPPCMKQKRKERIRIGEQETQTDGAKALLQIYRMKEDYHVLKGKEMNEQHWLQEEIKRAEMTVTPPLCCRV